MTYLHGECSYLQTTRKEEEAIQRRSSACCQQPPCLVRHGVWVDPLVVRLRLRRHARHAVLPQVDITGKTWKESTLSFVSSQH